VSHCPHQIKDDKLKKEQYKKLITKTRKKEATSEF